MPSFTSTSPTAWRARDGRGAPGWVIHGLCLALLVGRVLHADGVSQANGVFKFRVAGMVLTFSVFVVGAVTIVLT